MLAWDTMGDGMAHPGNTVGRIDRGPRRHRLYFKNGVASPASRRMVAAPAASPDGALIRNRRDTTTLLCEGSMALRVDEGYSARTSSGTADWPSRTESTQVESADAE